MPRSETVENSLVSININAQLTCVENCDQEELLQYHILSPKGHESACFTTSLLITDTILLLLTVSLISDNLMQMLVVFCISSF